MRHILLETVINEFDLEVITCEKNADEIEVITTEVNRPGLPLTGYLDHFGFKRIQIFGMTEFSYLSGLTDKEREMQLDIFFNLGFPCAIVARGMEIFPEMINISQKYKIPLLKTTEVTSRFMSSLIRFLSFQLAPIVSKHGVLVEVYGEGILLLGDSGVGKSETALELVKRGHKLISDDTVEIRKVSDKSLVGTAPEFIRHFIEIRGLGILNIRRLFGVGAVKRTKHIGLIIQLYLGDKMKDFEGKETDKFIEILGVKVPSINIFVRPGRNLAILVESAALSNHQLKL